jgi:hypothetical protein
LKGCCIHACHGNQVCISTCNINADHCCASACIGSPPYVGRGKRDDDKEGDDKDDKGGDDKEGDDKDDKGGDDKDDKEGDDKDDKEGKGGDDKDDKEGKGGEGKEDKGDDKRGNVSHRSQAFQDTTVRKITLGVGGVVLGILLIITVMTSVKSFR